MNIKRSTIRDLLKITRQRDMISFGGRLPSEKQIEESIKRLAKMVRENMYVTVELCRRCTGSNRSLWVLAWCFRMKTCIQSTKITK